MWNPIEINNQTSIDFTMYLYEKDVTTDSVGNTSTSKSEPFQSHTWNSGFSILGNIIVAIVLSCLIDRRV